MLYSLPILEQFVQGVTTYQYVWFQFKYVIAVREAGRFVPSQNTCRRVQSIGRLLFLLLKSDLIIKSSSLLFLHWKAALPMI